MKLLAAILATFMLMIEPGCATLAPYLPTAIAWAQDGMIILDQIQRFVDAAFARHPNPELQAKAEKAAARARAALSLALRTASGADKLNQAQLDAAFAEFKAAYLDYTALVGPLGVSSGGARLAASPGGGLVVPEPLALVRK